MALGSAILIYAKPASAQPSSLPESSAVFLAYYRVGDDEAQSSNLSMDNFQEHLYALSGPDLTPISVPALIQRLRSGESTPENAIGITFEAPYRHLLHTAIPELQKRKIPFTLFLNAQAVDTHNPQYMDWDDIQRLARDNNISFGLTVSPLENSTDDTEAKRLLNAGITKFRNHLGTNPKLFSYPQGEYTPAFKALLKQSGFDAAFGLQSGAAYEGSDFLALPRFTMTGNYGDIERFQTISHVLPLPATDMEPEASLLDNEEALIGFSLAREYEHLGPYIRCFASGQGRIEAQLLGETRVEIRPRISRGERLRVNCTAPAAPDNPKDKTQRWIGFLLSVKDTAAAELNNPAQGGLPPPPE
ncbi:MAG: polysaccharide deacetylase family protein [Alphaproteobacteria bacterium]|nr:polysaccharide deacetylase family protein [Alphaproteobacteria bacterium]MCD8571303.1 polysaccharide deacetylase family protein [Alphaproteobacteria bacterium]